MVRVITLFEAYIGFDIGILKRKAAIEILLVRLTGTGE
jgi:hypothetical protein